MFRRTSFSFFSAVIVSAICTLSAIAQSQPVSGKVELKKADGTVVPVEGATVEVFRTDINAGGPAAKTDKKGNFSFAGLQLGTYVLSISAPGAQPTYLPGVKPGTENLKFQLSEGDGRKLTPEEVRSAASLAATGGQLTEEQKKEQAEFAKKRAEVESKNEKIKQETAIIQASLKDGNAAFNEKNYDLAITKYDEGIAANPTFAGSAPILMNNRGIALRQRAVDTFNKNTRATDQAAKIEGMGKAKADFAESVETFSRSLNILKNAPATELSDPKLKESQTATALTGAKETFAMMAKTELVDETKLEIAKAMIPEYLTIESDAAKKAVAQTVLGDLFRVARDFDNAVAEYRKALELTKDHPDALAGLGLSLFEAGVVAKAEGDQAKNKALIDKGNEKMQEGLNYLNAFTQVAPDTHPLKASVKDATTYLTTEAKLAPQKIAPTKRRGN